MSVGLSGRSVTVVSPAKTTEPIRCRVGCGLGCVQGSMCYMGVPGVHTGATWRIRMNRPGAAAMRPVCQITLTTCCCTGFCRQSAGVNGAAFFAENSKCPLWVIFPWLSSVLQCSQ